MIRLLVFTFWSITSCKPNTAQTYQVTFKVTLDEKSDNRSIAIKGSVAPLSWTNGYVMNDEDGDGTYETTITFDTDKKNVSYKFQADGELELQGNDNRRLWFKNKEQIISHKYNEYEYFDEGKLSTLTLSPDQIKEDINILKNTIGYIHPNLHAYRSASELEADYKTLEAEMLANPTIPNAYKAISKFTSNIKCSHTFTNPWNQGTTIEAAIFNQPDKVPFTFSRIGKKIFIDKNASENNSLKKGLEILKINGVSTHQILATLTNYITSDGDNYEKRLERLTLEGDEKFALFDIFYSLEYGSQQSFKLELKDHNTDITLQSQVSAISKTKRTKILNDRYDGFAQSFEDGWQFQMIEKEIALLKINSFAVFNKSFDWEGFLDDVFEQLHNNNTKHLIIDIRKNEGGDIKVVEYLVRKIISSPLKIEAPKSITSYRKIPDELKTHISTWDKNPYNWRLKVKKIDDRKYQLRKIFSEVSKTYKPSKIGFRGKTYLLTGAQNSSATHLMATYAKKQSLATLIGQTTGGNQRGSNGGYMFFHRLPNSKVEIDIPVFGITTQEVTSSTPNGGIVPDILVDKNIPDLINGIDTELEATIKLIKSQEM